MKLLYVEWIDADTSIGWHEGIEDDSHEVVKTIGWYLGEDETYLVLCGDYHGDRKAKSNNRRIYIDHRSIENVWEICFD